MAILKESGIPKDGTLSKNDLEIEANGQYQLMERPDCFVVKMLCS